MCELIKKPYPELKKAAQKSEHVFTNIVLFRFWPALDNAIRSAAYRGVQVDLLISQWPHSNRAIVPYLKSLLEINKALPKPGGKVNIVSLLCTRLECKKN